MSRTSHLLRKFGITEDQYNDLLRKQEERCAVCRRHHAVFKKRLAVDHDHKTGEIRGLLCIHCNRYVVGRNRKDVGATLLKSAFEYLTAEYPGWVVPKKKKRRKKRRVRRN